MASDDRPPRRAERRVPRHRVMVSAEAEHAGAAGEAVNLSEGGACLALDDAVFDVGDELILWMHFNGPKHPVTATGRVVWTVADKGRPRCGLEWTHRGPQRDWIGWLTGM